jgi:hypothetical protein
VLDRDADLERGVAEALGDVIQADGTGVEQSADDQDVEVTSAAADQDRRLERQDEAPDPRKTPADTGQAAA